MNYSNILWPFFFPEKVTKTLVLRPKSVYPAIISRSAKKWNWCLIHQWLKQILGKLEMVFSLFSWVLNPSFHWCTGYLDISQALQIQHVKNKLVFHPKLTLSVSFHVSVNKPPCIQSPRSDPGVISISPSPLVYFLFHHSIVTSFYWFYPWYFSTHSLLHSHCACLISDHFPSVLVVYWPKWSV